MQLRGFAALRAGLTTRPNGRAYRAPLNSGVRHLLGCCSASLFQGVPRKFSALRFASRQSMQRSGLVGHKAGKFWFVGCMRFALAKPFIAQPQGVATV